MRLATVSALVRETCAVPSRVNSTPLSSITASGCAWPGDSSIMRESNRAPLSGRSYNRAWFLIREHPRFPFDEGREHRRVDSTRDPLRAGALGAPVVAACHRWCSPGSPAADLAFGIVCVPVLGPGALLLDPRSAGDMADTQLDRRRATR